MPAECRTIVTHYGAVCGIKEAYPDYLADIDTETASTEDLKKAIDEVNNCVTYAGTHTIYFSIDWDPRVLSWKDFNRKVIGNCFDPKCPEYAVNMMLKDNWDSLDLEKRPVVPES